MRRPLAAASIFTMKRSCISGSPPLNVTPPCMTLSPCAYLRSSSVARVTATGMPLRIVQVSGLWQYRQRHMQPVVHATTRTPGPSTAEPVVNECRKPMSPFASALCTSVSGTPSPRCTRRSNGLRAASGVSTAMEGPIDHVDLLLARETDEVHRVSRHANSQARILFRVIHGIQQRGTIEHVDVHVVAGGSEIRIQDAGEIADALLVRATEPRRHQ